MHCLRGIIFDFDGTLAELHIDFASMCRQVADLATLFLDRYIEPGSEPVLEWIEVLAEEMREILPREEVLEFQSRCRLRLTGLEMRAAKKGKLFAYTLDVLDMLGAQGVQTAVVTRNCSAAVTSVFPKIREHVGCVLARDDVTEVKPHPAHLGTAAACLGLAPERCLMVGDHWLDIQAAQRAGMYSAGVLTGYTSEAELKAYAPDFVAQDVEALVQELCTAGFLPATVLPGQCSG